MGNMFNTVALPMSKIVHGIDNPLITRAMMVSMFDAVHDRVTHVHVYRGHINLCTQHFFAIFEFPILHLFKKSQIFVNAPVAVFIFNTRLCRRSFFRSNFIRATIINVGESSRPGTVRRAQNAI